MWDAASVVLLRELWVSGQSAGQIASRLRHSRDAVCAKLLRMGLKRGHKPPTAKHRFGAQAKASAYSGCVRPVQKVVSLRKPVKRQPKELTKGQLNAMLADALANTARLPR
jgi:GcrA cell cycle regulator